MERGSICVDTRSAIVLKAPNGRAKNMRLCADESFIAQCVIRSCTLGCIQVPEADKLKQQVKELYKAGKYAIIFVLDHSEAVIEDFNAPGKHSASDLALVFIASNGVSFCRSFSKRSCS